MRGSSADQNWAFSGGALLPLVPSLYSFSTVKNAEMSFDVAYEPSNLTSTPKYSDTLMVYYSTDCGNTWTSIYSKGGATLSTTGSTTGAGTDTAGSHGHGCFEPPSNNAWRKDSVSLASLYGQASVMFSFESRSGWGNIVYLDNINVTAPGLTSIPDITNNTDVRIYPNPSAGVFNLVVSNYEPGMNYTISVYDLLGQQVYSASLNTLPQITQGFSINLGNKTNGLYFYRIANRTGDRIVAEGKLALQK